MSVTVIINPAAGNLHSPHIRRQVTARIVAAIPDCTILETLHPGHAQAIAQQHAPGTDMIVAVGGDGTANETANGILNSSCPDRAFSVIPLGTGNDFARALGVADVDSALLACRHGHTNSVDVLRVNVFDARRAAGDHRYALIYAAVGFPAEVVCIVGPWTKRLFGRKRCYTVGSLLAMLQRRDFDAHVSTTTFEFVGSCRMIWAANIAEVSAGTMRLSPGAQLRDGRMEFGTMQGVDRLNLIRTLIAILRGGHHVKMKHVHYGSGSELRVTTDMPQPVVLDGELFGHSPFTVAVAHRCLNVVVPPTAM